MSYSQPQGDRLTVIFVVFQTGSRANGGVESITQVIEHCPQIRPVVVTQLATAVNQRWQQAGAQVELWPLPSASRGRPTLRSLLRYNQRIHQLVRSLQARVVHCNDHSAVWHAAFGAKLAGAKVVFNIRDIKAADEAYDWRWRLACRVSDRQLLLSQEMRQQLIERLPIPPQRQARVQSIYSIVDSTMFHPVTRATQQAIRAQLGIPATIPALGYVATFSPKKAQLPFLEQVGPLLKQHLPTAQIYFVGDFEPERNPYAQACLQAVARLGLEQQVTFVGFAPNMADWYQAVDLTVIASRREGLARCMIESLACGTPVVSVEVCSAREILDTHDCGTVIPPGQYRALAAAIVSLLQDPCQRQQWGSQGAQTARQLFHPHRIGQQYAALYWALAQPTDAAAGSQPLNAVTAPALRDK